MYLDVPDTNVSSTVQEHAVPMVFCLVNHLFTRTSQHIVTAATVHPPSAIQQWRHTRCHRKLPKTDQ